MAGTLFLFPGGQTSDAHPSVCPAVLDGKSEMGRRHGDPCYTFIGPEMTSLRKLI